MVMITNKHGVDMYACTMSCLDRVLCVGGCEVGAQHKRPAAAAQGAFQLHTDRDVPQVRQTLLSIYATACTAQNCPSNLPLPKIGQTDTS